MVNAAGTGEGFSDPSARPGGGRRSDETGRGFHRGRRSRRRATGAATCGGRRRPASDHDPGGNLRSDRAQEVGRPGICLGYRFGTYLVRASKGAWLAGSPATTRDAGEPGSLSLAWQLGSSDQMAWAATYRMRGVRTCRPFLKEKLPLLRHKWGKLSRH